MITDHIGGAHPGVVHWIDEHAAYVVCNGHREPTIVYEAACHDGADLDDVAAYVYDHAAAVYLVCPMGHPALESAHES